MTATSPIALIVIGIGIAACVTDLRSRRIPNVLTFGAALAGLAAHVWLEGIAGVKTAAGGWLLGTVCFMPFFLLRGMGGGDVKLLAALGAWLGPEDTLPLALYSLAAGGVIGVVVALASGYLRTALNNIRGMLLYWRASGLRPVPDMTLETSNGPRLAYALPILAGTVITLWH
jgi:prepilin peptidase CpaA